MVTRDELMREVLTLLRQTPGRDVWDVVWEVFPLDAADVLGMFPDDLLEKAVAYLRDEQAALRSRRVERDVRLEQWKLDEMTDAQRK